MKIIKTLFLLVIISRINSNDCPLGFYLTRDGFCLAQYGPCATTDYDLSTGTWASTCLTCFNDAFLLKWTPSKANCIPNVCTGSYKSIWRF